jgi:SEC-C motif-containing protein
VRAYFLHVIAVECPCGTGERYDACCGRLHLRRAEAETAEELMRSRYAAYAVGELDHVFRTWHPRSRPQSIEPDPTLTWTGLTVLDVVDGGPGDEVGEVEFEATYERGGSTGRRHERSRFERRRGRWVYVDGDLS